MDSAKKHPIKLYGVLINSRNLKNRKPGIFSNFPKFNFRLKSTNQFSGISSQPAFVAAIQIGFASNAATFQEIVQKSGEPLATRTQLERWKPH